ncbi:MAG TPA: TonB-dependent receptor, partial [Verrucomicrobiae bacterium]
ASALYGSEAVGGVVNIITKKDYNGTEIGGYYGFATEKGTYSEHRVYVVSGITTEKASFIAGAQYFYNDPLLSRDRHSIAALDNNERAALGLAGASYISPSYAGKVQDGGTVYLLANAPFLGPQAPQGTPRPGYNPNLLGGPPDAMGNYHTPGAPPVFPGHSFVGPGAIDAYNAYAISQGYVDPTGNGFGPYVNTRAPGVGLGSATLLNTPEFGTHSILSQDRRQVFASGTYDLHGKEVQLFGDFLFSNHESVGALAPSPVISLFDAKIFVPANNVFNPFQTDLGPVGGAATPRVRSRFIQSGNRLFDALSDYYHFVGGLKGELEKGYTYNAGFTYNRYDQTQFTRNAINGAALDLALQPNPDPTLAAAGFSKLQTTAGFVPMYNIFFSPTAPWPTRAGPNSADTINAISTTLYQSGKSEEWDANFTVTGEPVELPGGKLGFAVGGAFGTESLAIDFDGLTRIGKVPGLLASDPTRGHRDNWNIYAEIGIPITSPKNDITGLHSLEIKAAGRFESFSPGGDSAIPKVQLRWQPVDEQFTLRAQYSQSFVAPTTLQLFGGDAQNTPFITTADGNFQETTINISNPTLKPVDAENYGAGIVYSPKAIKGLTISIDYYHVKTKNDIFRLSEQAMVNDLEQKGSGSIYAPNFTFDDGSVLTTTTPDQITSANWGRLRVPNANGASVETEGLDLSATYELPTENCGKWTFYANANYLFGYLYDDPVIHFNNLDPAHPLVGPYQYADQYTDRVNGIGGGQGLLPKWQLNTGVTWEYQNFTTSLSARYVPEVTDLGFLHPSVLDNTAPDQGFTLSGLPWKVDSWFAIDLQIAYEFGKGKAQKAWYDGVRVAVGANNITDEKPPLIASSFEDNTDKSTYDIIGRFIYFQLSKKF